MTNLYSRVSAVARLCWSVPQKRRKTRYIPRLQSLDERVVFASVSFDEGTGTVSLEEDSSGENNLITVNGTADRLTLEDMAGLQIASGHERFFTELSSNKVQLSEVAHLVILDTGDGNDVVGAGGTSVPTEMYLGDGDDYVISGSKVRDLIFGEMGNDLIYSSGGDDIVYGGNGDDESWASAGDDLIEGGDGDDLLRGGDAVDVIGGGSGNDMICGDAGDDTLNGGDGHDSLTGGAGRDIMDGGLGNDLFFAEVCGVLADYEIDGGGTGNDQDVLMFSSLTAASISKHIHIHDVEYGLADAMTELPALNYQQLLAWAGAGKTGHVQWTLHHAL